MLVQVAVVAALGLLVRGLAVLPPEPVPSYTLLSSSSMPPFPPLPLDFKDKARALMNKCSQMGYPPFMVTNSTSGSLVQKGPESSPFSLFLPLLSSLPPPPRSRSPVNQFNTTGAMNWNITERLMNCSSLLHAVEILRNTSDVHQCLLRAFVAPLAWEALVNGSNLKARERDLLLWASKVFLQEVPLPGSALPTELDHQQLLEMMGVFNEMFESISKDQKVKIVSWAKQQISQNHLNCSVPLPSGSSPPGQQKAKELCLPGTWLSGQVMSTMGRFLTLLPTSEFTGVPKEELCPFVKSDQFRVSFRKLGDDGSTLGKTLLSRVKQDCFSKQQEFLQNLDKLGPLICFHGDATSLNVSLIERLLPQLADCSNFATDKLRAEIAKKLVSGKGNLSPQSLLWLGPAMSVLPASWLANLPVSAIQSNLASLGVAKWVPVQARVLANTLLQGAQSVSSSDLLSLGSVVRGVRSSLLRRVEVQGLLGSPGLDGLTWELSTLQKVALLDGLQRNISTPDLVSSLPDGLLPQLSLEMLAKASLQSVEQVRDRSWSRAQAALIMSKILSRKWALKDLGKLGPAVQGVTCEMIDRTNQSDVMEMIQMLALNAQWLSRTQASCANAKLFYKDSNFSSLLGIDVNSIPVVLLLELNPKIIASLPKQLCPHFLEKMATANLSSLPMKSPSWQALTDKALTCLGRNLSILSPEDISRLGNLVCALDVRRLAGLRPEATNASLLALAKCPTLRRDNLEAIFTLLKATYGEPSGWTASTVASLGNLLLLNESILTSLPSEPWVKDALINVLDNLPQTPPSNSPEVFPTLTDLSALHTKLFMLTTGSTPVRTKRNVPTFSFVSIPTMLEIEDLRERNLYWSPAQLAGIPPQTFKDGVSILGMVHNYSALQLQALRNKTMEVWGQPGALSEEQIQQLGCVTQGFLHIELQELNITSLDTLEMLSSCAWEQRQRTAMWLGFMNRTGCTPAKLGTTEIVGLGQFLCGLSAKEIAQLRPETCREALGALGRIHCLPDIAVQLKEQVLKAIGAPASWSAAQVNSAGNILAALNASELQSLSPPVLPFIQPSTIPLIPPAVLAALSPSQLRALGPDNAAMVTEAQKQQLTSEQRATLGDTGSVSTTVPLGNPAVSLPQKAGARGLGSIGSAVFLPLLLLFVLKYGF